LENANMIHRFVGPGATRCALACLFLVGFLPSADAAFTATINGTTITDGGPGDSDNSVNGFINYQNTIDGYQIRLTSSTDNTHPTADLTTSQLRIVNSASAGTLTGPLHVVLSESFNAPPGYLGTQNMLNTLTRNVVAGLGTSGTVSSTTGGTSQSGGGSGTTGPVTLTADVDSGMSGGSFLRTSDFYTLTQTIDITGLAGQDALTITASSFSSSPANLSLVPAPAGVALWASGVMALGLYRLRRPRGPQPA
jgi:hypothetical protein